MSNDEAMKKIAEKFRADMRKLGLGVTIEVPGRPPVVVTEPPCAKKGCKNEATHGYLLCAECAAKGGNV